MSKSQSTHIQNRNDLCCDGETGSVSKTGRMNSPQHCPRVPNIAKQLSSVLNTAKQLASVLNIAEQLSSVLNTA